MSKKKVQLSESIEFPEQKIVPVDIEKQVRQGFIEYSMSVITSRALPDVRDGMKPGQRRILYAMYEDNLTYDKPFRKSATTVGNVLGRYHPHGDSAVYGTMVRMAQPFSYRYPLISGHGNFGNVDGDGAAAYRYTEARLSKIADEMMTDIEKNVVDFVPNFDNSRKEPVVLPSRFPNLLVNGSIGIAVGMATNIPTHNLGEVIDGTLAMMDNPDITVPELMQYIKGPDFPTYATIYGTRGIREAYETGRGRIAVRATAEIEEEHRRIVFTEIPYMVNKSMLVASVADLVKDKRIDGITDLRDESGRGGMRIVVEYRRDANPQVILNQLYKYTQLQDTCAVNMLALDNGVPRIFTLPEILKNYIAYQEGIITRRTQFDLDKALAEMHIYEGYKIAIDHIDEIIELIKKSASVSDAKANLMARYGLTDVQAQAIVDMTLGKLSGMERQKIEDRLAYLEARVDELRGILADESKVKGILREELTAIKEKFSDERRTRIVEATDDIDLEDLIERHTCVVTLTNAGYIKRLPADTYTAQHRGGKGLIGMTTKEEDFIEKVVVANSHSYILFFTNNGKVYMRKVYQIPEASRTAKGTNLVNLIEMESGERVTAMIEVPSFAEEGYLTMVTKCGIIKRTPLSEYEYQRKGGKRAISLDEGDELVFVRRTEGDTEIIIATHDGSAVRFEESGARAMGRTARGVRGIRVAEGDEVCGVALVEAGKKLVTITENGYGKLSDFEDFRTMKNRGGKGVAAHGLSEKTGALASIATVDSEDDLMLITGEGMIIRTPVTDIPTYSRTAGGVRVMRLGEGEKIVNFAKVARATDEDIAKADAEVPDDMPAQDDAEKITTPLVTEETTDEEI
ncbi:MAG: DNA gyrase subunit A [Oscillospiraceae bacterium]|nr:MAG: DNA gyrase subunit A [Oscillospiraceae bacterium]